MKKAVLFQNGSIGDFLMWVYLAEQLHESGRYSHITVVVPRNAEFVRELVEEYPYITVQEVSLSNPAGVFALMRGSKTALVHPTIGRIPLRVKILAWGITRAKGSTLVGFQDAGLLCSLYDQKLSYDTTKPYIETVRELVRLCGGEADQNAPRLKFAPLYDVAEIYGLTDKKYIVFHPGASNPRRMFGVSAATEVVDFLLKTYPDITLVLSGGAEESALITEIVSRVGKERIRVAVNTGAREIASLIYFSELFIGTDSGMTHLACFLDKQVLEVAHNATQNWLAFYHPRARVLYRLAKENTVRSDEEYLKRNAGGILKPFGEVPVEAVCAELTQLFSPKLEA